jgi:hypothetical protein
MSNLEHKSETQRREEEVKDKIKEFMQSKKLTGGGQVKQIEFQRAFQFGAEPILCFEIETNNGKNPYWIVFVTVKEDTDIPNAAYSVNLFDYETIEELGIDVFHATFNYHIGMMLTHQKNMEYVMEEAKHATKH